MERDERRVKRVSGGGGGVGVRVLRLNMKGRVGSGERAISGGKITFIRASSGGTAGCEEGPRVEIIPSFIFSTISLQHVRR